MKTIVSLLLFISFLATSHSVYAKTEVTCIGGTHYNFKVVIDENSTTKYPHPYRLKMTKERVSKAASYPLVTRRAYVNFFDYRTSVSFANSRTVFTILKNKKVAKDKCRILGNGPALYYAQMIRARDSQFSDSLFVCSKNPIYARRVKDSRCFPGKGYGIKIINP